MRLEYTVPHQLNALHDELIAAGIAPTYLGDDPDNAPDGVVLEVPDGTAEAAVAAVIAAHDPAAVAAAKEAAQQATRDARALVVNLAQSAVGVRFDLLTAAQVRALAAILFWKEGALTGAGLVRPLAEWVQD
jgi:predicted NAD/FAD-binding protein